MAHDGSARPSTHPLLFAWLGPYGMEAAFPCSCVMMNRTLQKNIFWTMFSRFGSQILAITSNVLLARYLGAVGFGVYAFISAIVMIGNAASTFGTDMVLIRRISSRRNYSDLGSALVMQLLISLIFIIGVFVFYSIFPVTSSLLIYSFVLIPLAFFTVFTITLRGAQEMQSFSILHFLSTIFHLLAVLLLILKNGDIVQLVTFLLIAQVMVSLLGFILCTARIDKFISHWKFSWNGVLLLFRESSQMAVIGTLRLAYEKLAISLLPLLSGVQMTGLFSASMRVMDAAKLGHLSALTAIYPEMARDGKFVTRRTGFDMLLVAAGIISLIIFLFAKQIILILFGDQFISSVQSLHILAWILIPYFVVSYHSLLFVAIEVEKPVLFALIASLLLMITLLITLIPFYGLRGAAIALLSAELFHAIFLWLQWRSYAFPKSSK
jgi:O-antigen/teichoic acid export membrane protein